jgi:hypothetical protein
MNATAIPSLTLTVRAIRAVPALGLEAGETRAYHFAPPALPLRPDGLRELAGALRAGDVEAPSVDPDELVDCLRAYAASLRHDRGQV